MCSHGSLYVGFTFPTLSLTGQLPLISHWHSRLRVLVDELLGAPHHILRSFNGVAAATVYCYLVWQVVTYHMCGQPHGSEEGIDFARWPWWSWIRHWKFSPLCHILLNSTIPQ